MQWPGRGARVAANGGEWEYVTYAPPGHKCSACLGALKALEPVRRGAIDGAAGAPVVYRHVHECLAKVSA